MAPSTWHLFRIKLGGIWYRDDTAYSDADFEELMALLGDELPYNLRVTHFQSDDGGCKRPWVLREPVLSLPVAALFAADACADVLLQDRGNNTTLLLRTVAGAMSTAEVGGFLCAFYADGTHYRFAGRYRAVPLAWKAAKRYVNTHHRHCAAPQGHKFSIGAQLGDAPGLGGVLIASEPKARNNADGFTLELNRCCSEEQYGNACSFLYARGIQAGRAMGYRRFVTYTLPTESGASLRAVGFRQAGVVKGQPIGWDRPSRKRKKPQRYPDGDKLKWILERE